MPLKQAMTELIERNQLEYNIITKKLQRSRLKFWTAWAIVALLFSGVAYAGFHLERSRIPDLSLFITCLYVVWFCCGWRMTALDAELDEMASLRRRLYPETHPYRSAE